MVTLQPHFSLSSSTDFRHNQARKERKQSGIQLPTEQGLKVGHLDLICMLPIAPPDFLPIRFLCPILSHRQLRPNFYVTLFFFNLKSNAKDSQDSNYGAEHGGTQLVHTCNPATSEVEARGSGAMGHCQLHVQGYASLNMRGLVSA